MNNNDSWKILKRERLLKTPVFDIYKENAVCARNNSQWNFYTIDCPHNWVTVVAVTKNKEIVMVKQFRYGSKKTELEVPGGLVEQDESPVAAGVRELREETGYVGSSAALLGKVCPNPALQGNYCYTVLVENAELKHETEFDSAEDIETLLIPLEEFRLKILNSEITHGLTLNSLYFYDIEMMKQRMEQ